LRRLRAARPGLPRLDGFAGAGARHPLHPPGLVAAAAPARGGVGFLRAGGPGPGPGGGGVPAPGRGRLDRPRLGGLWAGPVLPREVALTALAAIMLRYQMPCTES